MKLNVFKSKYERYAMLLTIRRSSKYYFCTNAEKNYYSWNLIPLFSCFLNPIAFGLSIM
jgi:hypothetical protein